MIQALAHVCLYSKDLARTEAFYGNLGLPVQFRFMKEGKLIGFYLKITPGQFIEVFLRDSQGCSGDIPIGHLCLEVADLVEVRAKLSAFGVETTEPKLGADQSWQMWCKDPDGTPIEFHQYTPESLQRNGGDCVVNW
jgi:catechol 2,3-dioxygenase-like lactoylglutathione lyase family enzyme